MRHFKSTLLAARLAAFACLLFPFAFFGQVPAALDSILKSKLEAQRISLGVRSLSAALDLPDGSVWAGASGISSLVPYQKATPEHRYEIGSITKTITAAAVLQLVDAGLLGLDDAVGQHLGPFSNVDSAITIRQLLRHQSGLYDCITNPDFNTTNQGELDSIWSLENLVNDYTLAPLAAAPAPFSYSNTNYALLGLLVQKATGKPYWQDYRDRFWQPLGLGTFSNPPFDAFPDPHAHAWLDVNGDGATDDIDDFFSNWNSFFSAAGPIGGYWATASEVAKWIKIFGSGQLHSAATMAEAKMTVSGAGMPSGTTYGLGLMKRKFQNLEGWGHGGDLVFSSMSFYFPEKGVSVAVLNNDAKKNSWQLAPVVNALLKACIDYEMSVSTSNPLIFNALEADVFPNPFSEKLQIRLELPENLGQIDLVLTDLFGREKARRTIEKASSGEQFFQLESLAALPEGSYFLRAESGGERLFSKLILKNGGF